VAGFDPNFARQVDDNFDHVIAVEDGLQRAKLLLHSAPGFIAAVAGFNP
jgi:hypothetical protein